MSNYVCPECGLVHGRRECRATFYRGFRIEYDPPPIPASCGVGWSWTHEDYDGPGDSRHGRAKSLDAAKEAIDDWYLENLEQAIAEEFEPEADTE